MLSPRGSSLVRIGKCRLPLRLAHTRRRTASIQANADHHSRVPREQLAEIAKVNHTMREYLVELERENPVEPPVAFWVDRWPSRVAAGVLQLLQ